jgi:hypothetical protein
MLTVQQSRPRVRAQRSSALALLVLMLLASALWPAALQAQEPLPAEPPLGGTVPALPDVADEELLVPAPPPMFEGPGPMGAEDPDAAALIAADAAAGDVAEGTLSASDAAILAEANAGTFKSHMPLVASEWAPNGIGERLGFGSGAIGILSFPQVRDLGAGWYVNWTATVKPPRPNGMQFMQMVRLHQVIDEKVQFAPGKMCGIGVTADRTICPYAVPHSYIVSPSLDYIKLAAKANPGSVWLIGNEMERSDWAGGRQDEMLPELYARAYHEVRAVIKAADPTAKIAIGGVIQFTPLRASYLTKVWNAYAARYGVNMPVDVWNVHNFIGPEYCEITPSNGRNERFCWGMGIPVGTTGKFSNNKLKEFGVYYGEDWRIVHQETFDKQIRGMRTWMRDRGQANKPLIVTEYGVLWPSMCYAGESLAKCKERNGDNFVDLTIPANVHNFMTWTFDYFATEEDCTLSGVDDCRLVQQWAWFGLDDIQWGFNPHAVLTNTSTYQLSEAGWIFSRYVKENLASLQIP